MEKNLLNHYSVKRLESIEKQLSNYICDQKAERLHRLRVDIKKVKAILSFGENVYEENYDLVKLKPLFLEAGKIRGLQINIRVVSSAPEPPKKLINKLQKKEAILVQNFIRHASKYTKLLTDFRAEISLPESLPGKKIIKKYFKKERRKAHKILLVNDRECVHKYRMKIKKLIFINNALPKKIQNEIDLNESEMKKLDKKLGNWHDLYSAVKYLSLQHLPAKEKEIEYYLITKERKQFDALYTGLTKDISGKAS